MRLELQNNRCEQFARHAICLIKPNFIPHKEVIQKQRAGCEMLRRPNLQRNKSMSQILDKFPRTGAPTSN